MSYYMFALTVIGVALSVIAINVAMLAVVSTDVMVWKDERQKVAQKYTYWLSLEIAAFAFAVWWFAG